MCVGEESGRRAKRAASLFGPFGCGIRPFITALPTRERSRWQRRRWRGWSGGAGEACMRRVISNNTRCYEVRSVTTSCWCSRHFCPLGVLEPPTTKCEIFCRLEFQFTHPQFQIPLSSVSNFWYVGIVLTFRGLEIYSLHLHRTILSVPPKKRGSRPRGVNNTVEDRPDRSADDVRRSTLSTL